MTSPKPSTRDRIVSEASRLFAAQGIKATTVAQLEEAVGLRKGSGGIHRYFASKDDLVEAVFAAQLTRGREILDEATAIPVPDPSDPASMVAFVTAIGAKVLRDAEHSREVSLIVFRDGPTLPEAAMRHVAANDEVAYQFMADSLRAQMNAAPNAAELLATFDPEAFAFLFIGPMIFFKLSDWLSGRPKLGLTDERLLTTWVAVFEPVLQRILSAAAAATPALAEPAAPVDPPAGASGKRRPKAATTKRQASTRQNS